MNIVSQTRGSISINNFKLKPEYLNGGIELSFLHIRFASGDKSQEK